MASPSKPPWQSYGPSGKSTINPSELSTTLAALGLSQYEERLQQNGFEDWETVTAITEADLAELNFKRGNRRKLQNAIREYKNSSARHRLHEAGNLPTSSQTLSADGEDFGATQESSLQPARATRRYRRHPQPDSNAPLKPKTAYVLFGEHARQDPAVSQMSFTEIAKETGRRWRELSLEEKMAVWETPAADRLQAYREEFALYKQTEESQSYQTYLESFKQQQHNTESAASLDHKPSSIHESAFSGQLPALDKAFDVVRQESVDTYDSAMEDQSRHELSPIRDGIREVRHITKALGVNPHLERVAAFPPEEMTAKAVEAFVHGTGSLLYFWNWDEAFDLVRSVYRPQSDSQPVYTTEVFAMSAIGSYCDAEAHSELYREKFLHFFLYMLSTSSDMSDLRHMRLLACLAICRFTNSVESARKLMSKRLMLSKFRLSTLTAQVSALNIGRQVIASASFKTENSKETARYWRKVFRSVVFLERSARSTLSRSRSGLLIFT
jgi:hypothetical protein